MDMAMRAVNSVNIPASHSACHAIGMPSAYTNAARFILVLHFYYFRLLKCYKTKDACFGTAVEI